MIILWLSLFLLILAISFVLAYTSMKDYKLSPKKNKSLNYGLYLIRNPSLINSQFLNNLHKLIAKDALVISFERLFKGQESALVVYGPKSILEAQNLGVLSLIELENYTQVLTESVYAWEVGMPKNVIPDLENYGGLDLFENFPDLFPEEQFWWQVCLSAHNNNSDTFLVDLKAVFVAEDSQRRKEIGDILQNLSPHLVKLPKSFSSPQILQFYRERNLTKVRSTVVNSKILLKLLKL